MGLNARDKEAGRACFLLFIGREVLGSRLPRRRKSVSARSEGGGVLRQQLCIFLSPPNRWLWVKVVKASDYVIARSLRRSNLAISVCRQNKIRGLPDCRADVKACRLAMTFSKLSPDEWLAGLCRGKRAPGSGGRIAGYSGELKQGIAAGCSMLKQRGSGRP